MFFWVIVVALTLTLVWLSMAVHSAWQYPQLELAILSALEKVDEIEGRELRSRLHQQGFRLSAVRFYQIMAHLEDGKVVEGWCMDKTVHGIVLRSRWYRLRHEDGRRGEEKRFQRAIRSLLPLPV